MMKRETFFDGERAIPLASNMIASVMEEHLCRYQFAQRYTQGIVLDCACGVGYGTEMLSYQADFVIGIDISEDAVGYANETYKKSNTHFMTSDATHLPFDDSFVNNVVSFETIEHLPSGVLYLLEVTRVLKPNGNLFLSIPIGGPCENPFHLSFYQRLLFDWFLLGFFKVVELKFQRGKEIYNQPTSNWINACFPDEYLVAVCKLPYKNHTPFGANFRLYLYLLLNATCNNLIMIKRKLWSSLS